MTIEDFVAQIKKREMPRNPMAKVEMYARELAEGAAHGLWSATFNAFAVSFEGRRANSPEEQVIYQYIEARWGDFDSAPKLALLVQNGYLHYEFVQRYEEIYSLTKAAFDLLSTSEASSIFVSYKRSESSSFSLLIAHILRHAGFDPFVDMQLEAGSDWREQLRDSIRQSDYLILLIAPTTLESKVTLQEIEWAMDAETTIVPIWHRGFSYKASDLPNLPETIHELVADTHTIRVTEETPLAYNSAISELLNRFGISS